MTNAIYDNQPDDENFEDQDDLPDPPPIVSTPVLINNPDPGGPQLFPPYNDGPEPIEIPEPPNNQIPDEIFEAQDDLPDPPPIVSTPILIDNPDPGGPQLIPPDNGGPEPIEIPEPPEPIEIDPIEIIGL